MLKSATPCAEPQLSSSTPALFPPLPLPHAPYHSLPCRVLQKGESFQRTVFCLPEPPDSVSLSLESAASFCPHCTSFRKERKEGWVTLYISVNKKYLLVQKPWCQTTAHIQNESNGKQLGNPWDGYSWQSSYIKNLLHNTVMRHTRYMHTSHWFLLLIPSFRNSGKEKAIHPFHCETNWGAVSGGDKHTSWQIHLQQVWKTTILVLRTSNPTSSPRSKRKSIILKVLTLSKNELCLRGEKQGKVIWQ